ncbi:diguanylate cyclase [Paenibacillus psychroresistens]|uniref:Diguanylate cyclase n=1 Tax=Paenibacillus psychroresistens TaxID=1778678 RepID=A0A6B8RKY9_9BACL|nr:diguanylate cyclase [Paenibacillus psychroresistens]QGQ96970.1 diguanylate cyclase [Paenibacillus psychroresistens]
MTSNLQNDKLEHISIDQLLDYKPTQLDEMLTASFIHWIEQLSVFSSFTANTYFVCSSDYNMLHISSPDNSLPINQDLIIRATRAANEAGEMEYAVNERDQAFKLGVLPIHAVGNQLIGSVGIIYNMDQSKFSTPRILSSFLPHILLQAEKMENKRLLVHQQEAEQKFNITEMLFEVVQTLHSLNDVESVLTEVIDRIGKLYPLVQVSLLLSQDNQSSSLPVKPLNFTSAENDICTRAFMEGELIYNPAIGEVDAEVAAPLSGKQGVYGVLHLHVLPIHFDHNDIQFIRLLASSAGAAFENAKLYEQSNFLVNELRLINDITIKLNQSLKLSEIFSFASSELINIFGADFSCVLQMDKTENEMVVQASNLPTMFQEKFSVDYGFSGLVYTTKEPIIISDYWSNPVVQSKLMEVTGSRSMIASPILVNNEVMGVILVTHRYPNFFSYDNYKLLQVLSGHIGLTIANASLHAEVKRMVITDNLTGLYARHYLDEQVNFYQKKDFCGSLIVVDIDNFKGVNDTFGHQIGDKILIQVSSIIKTCIRDSDIAARWGGEELAIYLPQVSIDQAVRIAERIRNRVFNETQPKVTVSCGVSDWHWEDEKISVELLFYKSDMALYKAKHDGKNQIKVG